jgi:hypothetical protein
MTAPDVVDQLDRRLAALEAEHFALLDELRRVRETAELGANGLDAIERALSEAAITAAEQDDAMVAAIAQREAQLSQDEKATAPPPSASGPEPPDLAMLHTWVDTHIAIMVRKTTTTGEGGGIRWCRQWWEHPDAVTRFTALYLAFTQLSAEKSPIWLSVYLRDHVDPHLATLTSPYGPFHACTPRKHAIEALGHAELTDTEQPGRKTA